MIFGGNRRLSSAIDSNRASTAIDNIRWQSAAIAKSIAVGGIRLLSIAIALSARAAIETAGEWAESASIRFESRDWAADVMAGAQGNASIAVEGGRLLSNAIWTPPATHLVLNTVYVPSGITLTITTNCVVKFCPGTTIKVEDGGKLNIAGSEGGDVIFTAANDATAGEAITGFEAEQSIAFEGIRLQSGSATFTDNGWLETRGFDYGAFPGISVNATEAVRNGGMAYVPFTLSGSSRDKAFSVEWEAVAGTAAYGDDYTLASGRITWNKSGDGTKTLAIPLNTANITGEDRTFTVRIKAARCANVVRREATVKIVERDGLTLEWADEWAESAPPIRFESREWAEPVMAGATNNAAIAIEGGRLQSNAVWNASSTHLVLNTVYVPSGITLTITAGAVVKYCPGTTIKVEDGGKLVVNGADGNDVILTAANDATVGEPIAGFDAEQSIAFDGIRLQSSAASFTDNDWLETRGFTWGSYPSVSLNDVVAFRSAGEALLPVTVGGATRNQSFTVEWEAIDGTAKLGEDYTLASGRITWAKSGDGTKTLRIPLVADHLVGSNTEFKVRLTVSRGANIARGECTVTIKELDTLDLAWGEAESNPPIRFESREWMEPVLAGVANSQSIAIEGGRLQSNAVWNASVTHLVLNDVIVPSGVTLAITAGAIVKYGPGTTIKVEDGGKLVVNGADGNDVILTAANDATVGEAIAGFDAEQSIAFDGIRLQSSSASFTDNGWLQTRGFTYGTYPTLTIHDATANRKAGMIYLPVTVSGSRNQAFTVDWATEDETAQFGRDYTTSNAGRLTWSKTGDGTKYIAIPLAKDVVAGTNRTFKVKFVTARCCNVSRGEAVATIAEFENGGIESYDVVEWTPSEPSAEFPVNEGLKTQPLFLNDTETVQYSGKWQTYDANEAAVLRVTLETDNGATVLKEASPFETGAFDLDLKQYPVGYYTLKHEILNDLGETLATMQKTFSIADEEDVELHGGTLKQNEVWSADKVHVVYETVVVPSVYTIFIEPGAIVKFMTGTGIDISQGGAFFANRIVFTHINDDTVGGDTLNDGFTVAPPMDAYFLSGAFTFGDDTELRGITQNNALTGTIATQKTLSRGSTYRVSGTLTIASGGSLTIPAGTVLKMEAGSSIVVNSGATFNAIGTRASPIVITSIRDDSYSGDTNGDGGATIPQPGDWEEIKNNGGTMNLAFVTALYGGYGQYANQGDAIIRTANGETKMDCCVVKHSNLRLVGRTGGTVYAENCILEDGRWGIDGAVTFVNGVIANCNTGATGAMLKNSILWVCDTYASGGTASNCVAYGEITTVQTGMTYADPLFVDPVNGDFRVKEGSPCVDAADDSVAPELDFYGQPRITITDHGDELVGQLADIGICEVMPRDVVSDIDLVPQSVRTTTNAVPGQLLFVKWEIANVGGREVEAAWRDTVSLVSESGREVVLGVKTTSSRIGVGGSVFCSGYFTVPAIAEGTWYPKVNVNSYHDIFEGSLAANNALTGERAVSVGLEVLDPSIAREGVINGGTPTVLKLAYGEDAENRMVKFDVPAGVKATWGFGFMPGGARSGASGSMTASGDGVMFRVPDGATDVYVVLESDTTTTYNLSTESTQMTITSVTPATLPSSGTTTLTIAGAGFGEANEVSLVSAIGRAVLSAPQQDAAGNLVATVDCSALTAGQTYAVRVESGANAAELPGAVSVVKAEGKGILELEYDVPSSVRPGRVFTFTVTYRNTGNKDMCVPLLTVQDTGNDTQNPIQFSLDGERFMSGGFQFVGNDAEGGFGPLHPGDEVTLLLMAKIPPANNGSTAVSVRANTESDIMAKYTTEIDRYLTPAMKAEFAATTDAELKARGERMVQVFGANNGEMVQNFAALAGDFLSASGYAVREVRDLVMWMVSARDQTLGTTIEGGSESPRRLLGSIDDLLTGAYLYPTMINLNQQTVDLSDGDVVIIAHGMRDSMNSGWMKSLASSLLGEGDGKFKYVVLVDWSGEADVLPVNPWDASEHIGEVANIVQESLKRCCVDPTRTTLIGHSFGSHLLGWMAQKYFGLRLFKRHVGLDTAATSAASGFVVNGSCAKITEYYRSSSGSGRNDAYADYNYIVANKDSFNVATISAPFDAFLTDHSYAHQWFRSNVLLGKGSDVGFWRQDTDKGGKNLPTSGFIGIIYGPDNILECNYPFVNGSAHNQIHYPGNKSGWLEMGSAWANTYDLQPTNAQSVENAQFKTGIPRRLNVDVRDVCDILTINRVQPFYRVVVSVGDLDGSNVREIETLPWQLNSHFDFEITLPHDCIVGDSQEKQIRFTVYGEDMLENRVNELYDGDNTAAYKINVQKGTGPEAAINNHRQNNFVINCPQRFDSYEEYAKSYDERETFVYTYDGRGSKAMDGSKLEKFAWYDGASEKPNSDAQVFQRMYYKVSRGDYPIRLVVTDDLGRSASINGILRVYPVIGKGDPIEQPKSYDPNEMVGPLGVGDPETERFVKPGEWLTYTIYFENQTNATAAAQEVYVSQALSANLDWSTFEMAEVAFGDQIDLGLAGKNGGSSDATMTGTNLIVRTSLALDETTGLATLYLRIVDPTADTGWPKDILAGFLPPNDPETHCGEGHITYRVKVRDDAPKGARIDSSATIVFDYNDPIETDPAWWNTVAQMAGVTIHDGDGAEPTPLIVGMPYGDTLPESPKSDRPGYTFAGWYTGPNGTGRRVTAQSIVRAGDTGLYAKWLAHAYNVRFNANGGTGTMSNQAFEFDKPGILDSNAFVRAYHDFEGWATNATEQVRYANGATVTNLTATDGAVVDLFAKWNRRMHTVSFYANKRMAAPIEVRTVGEGLAVGVLPTAPISPTGYSFAGWRDASNPKVAVDANTIVTDDMSIFAIFSANVYTVTFNANGGTVSPASKRVEYGEEIGDLPVPVRTGYSFVDWKNNQNVTVTATTIYETAGNSTLMAQWSKDPEPEPEPEPEPGHEQETVWTVTFDANGGAVVGSSSMSVTNGFAIGTLPEAVRKHYSFLGWFTAMRGGDIAYGTEPITANRILYAQWDDVPYLYDSGDAAGAAPGAMSEYNGYLVDAAGNVKGTIQIKVGKPNAKTGIASVKGTVVPVGGKKTTIKANGNGKAKIETTGPTTLPFAGGEACSVTLGATGMSGSYGAWTIDGVRNLLASKDKAEKAVAEAAFAPLKTTLNIVWDGGVAALTVANKGKAKVKGTLATGGKLNASAQLLVGEKWACVPVAVAKSGLTFTVWISLGSGSRSYHVVGLGDDVAIGKAGSLPANAKFTMDPDDATARWGAVLGAAYVKYLPDGMSVKPNGTKWEIAKAGKITMKKGVVDTSKARENPSGLKLTYKAKDGSFKGSFKIYAEVNGRLKATTVNVSGVMVGNAACGTATVKKLGSVGVTIE